MRTKLFIINLLLFTLTASAYNYQTLYSQRTALYNSLYEGIITMKIDSTIFNGDSILYPLKNIQRLDYVCYTPYGASWLGAKIIVKPGWNYFLNENNDTVKIKTDAKMNEQWTVISNSTVTVFATVQKIDTLSFLGITDSVKTIVFRMVIPTSGTPSKISNATTDFDGKTIQLSKNYGLIKTFNFLIFPKQNQHETYITGSWDQYILSGLTNPKIGVQNLTWFEVFDFQPGDEIHTVYNYCPPLGPPPPGGYIYKTEEITNYQSKETYADSIVYYVDVQQQIYSTNSTNYIKYTHRREVVKQNEKFNILPNVPVISDFGANSYSMYISSSGVSKSEPSIWNEIIRHDNCWTLIIADGCFRTNHYIKSLGGPYFYCDGFNMETEERSLVYYKKGNTTWGVPYLHLAVAPVNQQPAITLSPNPASDIIRLANLPENSILSIELYDLKGIKLLQSTISQTENALDISVLDKGLYLYRISSENGLIQSGKIAKN